MIKQQAMQYRYTYFFTNNVGRHRNHLDIEKENYFLSNARAHAVYVYMYVGKCDNNSLCSDKRMLPVCMARCQKKK